MENKKTNPPLKKDESKEVNVINGVILLVMLVGCIGDQSSGLILGLLGLVCAVVNLVLIFVYAQRKSRAYWYCIIWTAILGIVGLGCCGIGLRTGF